jgi:hypothetical protein
MPAIVLTRKEIVEAYCYLREAERSLHRALNPACPWRDLLAYYVPSKVNAVQRLAALFPLRLPGHRSGFPTATEVQRLPPPGILRRFFGICFGPMQRNWRFRVEEIAYLGTVFDALVRFLLSRDRPGSDELISARMALCDAQTFIRRRCPGLAELKQAEKTAHFDQSPDLANLPVADILRDVA